MFEYRNPMEHVNAWFDCHPHPADIEKTEFTISLDDSREINIEVFQARDVFDTFLIKLTFYTARKAMTISRSLNPLMDSMGITQILIYNKLFLFQDQRF